MQNNLWHTHTHTHTFNGPFSGTTRVSRYQKGKLVGVEFNAPLDTKPIWILLKQDSESQWHQLGHMQVCTSLQTDNHASTPPLCFLQAGCPSCCPTNSIKALNATVAAKQLWKKYIKKYILEKYSCYVATSLRATVLFYSTTAKPL